MDHRSFGVPGCDRSSDAARAMYSSSLPPVCAVGGGTEAELRTFEGLDCISGDRAPRTFERFDCVLSGDHARDRIRGSGAAASTGDSGRGARISRAERGPCTASMGRRGGGRAAVSVGLSKGLGIVAAKLREGRTPFWASIVLGGYSSWSVDLKAVVGKV